MKIAVSGERLGRALPSTLNISINYFRPVSVNIVIFLGKQGLDFRGNRDDIIMWVEDEYKEENQGNFIELVCFQAETDSIVKKHL